MFDVDDLELLLGRIVSDGTPAAVDDGEALAEIPVPGWRRGHCEPDLQPVMHAGITAGAPSVTRGHERRTVSCAV